MLINDDCSDYIEKLESEIDMTFLDPPFNQDKNYPNHDDSMDEDEYWEWIKNISADIYDKTSEGGSIYFMQREKNSHKVMKVLEESGWDYRNLIIWEKMTSPVPYKNGYNKSYQVIAFYTKGSPKTFNKLRHDPPTPENYNKERENGIYVNDIWDNIRELTSGYFAGDEPLTKEGNRVHKQQSPLHLVARMVLTSTMPGDTVLDPFSGTGTTHVVCNKLDRECISIEKSEEYYKTIKDRIDKNREEDNIDELKDYYSYTEDIDNIWNRSEN
jgi:DNA modification methylase